MRQPIKIHGGKHYLASRLVALMPEHELYVEPYCGGASVLLAKPCEGVSEVLNDIDPALANFWVVMQSPGMFEQFARYMQAVPFSERVFDEPPESERGLPMRVQRAARFFIRCRMSRCGNGKNFATLSKNRTRRGMNEQVSAWLSAVDGLPEVHERLRRVLVLNRDGLDVIRSLDTPHTLFYIDPPYVPETRSVGAYRCEMGLSQHQELLGVLASLRGRFMLSGYDNELYREAESAFGLSRREFDLPNNVAGGTEKRRMTECVWMNYEPT